MPAGQLRELLRFEERIAISDDGYGNREAEWIERFRAPARIEPQDGSEQMIAERQAGVNPVRITLRWSSSSIAVTNGWRCVDCRNEARIFNITAAMADERSAFIRVDAVLGIPT